MQRQIGTQRLPVGAVIVEAGTAAADARPLVHRVAFALRGRRARGRLAIAGVAGVRGVIVRIKSVFGARAGFRARLGARLLRRVRACILSVRAGVVRRRGVALVGRRGCARCIFRGGVARAGFGAFEEGVFLKLLFDVFGQFLIRQLQQLDRLLQLRRHHQLLGLPEFQFWS